VGPRLPPRAPPAAPRGAAPPPRLALEALEDRVVPAPFVDLGPLRFGAEAFTVVGNNYSASGQVQLGLAPAQGEAFTPLVNINTPLTDGSVSFTVDTPDPRFTVTNATVQAVVQGLPLLTLWSTTSSFTFDAAALASTGVPLAAGAVPFPTNEGQFTLTNRRCADPTGGSTEDAQIMLQGSLSNPVLVGLNMTVTGSNFLILDQTGLTLTGVDKAVSGGLSVGGLGFDISGLSVNYNN